MPLLIGEAEQQALVAAVERARKHPRSINEVMHTAGQIDQTTDVVTLADRKAALPKRAPEVVALPVGYVAAISFEEQPAGMCMHVSMSTMKAGMIPRPEAMAMVLETIGVRADVPRRVWIEEFEIDGKSGGYAINVVAVMEPAQGGHA